MKYEITAEYTSTRRITVNVPRGQDPMVPENWGDIENEVEEDLYLSDVVCAEKSREKNE